MESPSGRWIGQYQILEEIGRGGMAVVYRAYQPSLNRYVAIKVLPPQLAFDQDFVARFHREAQAVAGLRHPHIVVIHDVGYTEGLHYIVMEYLKGQTLKEIVVEEGPLPPERVLRILGQIASALDYAHEQGFIHRDVKPANIFVGDGEHVTLTDFGIAKAAGEAQGLTRTGMLVGTPEYMAPEQAEGKIADRHADIYALGVVLYQMLVGRVPFQGTTPHAVLHAVIYEPPPPPRQINPRLSPSLEPVLLRALAKRPETRFQSGSELVAAMRSSLQVKARPLVRHRRSSLPWILGGIAGILVIVGLLSVLLNDGHHLQATPVPVVVLGTAQATFSVATSPITPSITRIAPTATVPLVAPSAEPSLLPPTATPLPSNTPLPPTDTPVLVADTSVLPRDTTTPLPTAGPVVVFVDHFDGQDLDSSKWELDRGAGNVVIRDSVIRVDSSGRRFPYLYSRDDPFPPQGDFQIAWRFHYAQVRDCGVGIIVSSYLVPVGLTQSEAAARQQEAESTGVQAGVWQDGENGLQLWFRSGRDRADIPFPGPNRDWNEMTIRYRRGKYTLYLNGSLAYTSAETLRRPRCIWIGHPADLGTACSWDVLEVDYVKVESLP